MDATTFFFVSWVIGIALGLLVQFLIIRWAVLSALKAYAVWKREYGVEKRIHARDVYGVPWQAPEADS